MNSELIIVGSGGFGREILAWLPGVLQKEQLLFKGFLDDDLALSDFGKVRDFKPQPQQVFVCAIGSCAGREEVVTHLLAQGARFVNLVHQTAVVASRLKEDSGLIIAPFVFISTNVQVGTGVIFNVASSVGHDAKIGNFTTLSGHCDVTGNVVLGSRVFMGSHACIIPGRVVGDNALIGAGSAVMRNVPAGVTVIGVPAKKLM